MISVQVGSDQSGKKWFDAYEQFGLPKQDLKFGEEMPQKTPAVTMV